MKPLLLVLLLLLGFSTHAQPSAWTFALPATTANALKGVATDADGNAYVTGTFTGSTQVGGTTITSSLPGPCLYIAKISPKGRVLRVTKLEGATEVGVNDIAVDADGNSFVTGRFIGTLTYNGGQQTTSRLNEPGGYNILLVKCGKNGAVRWIQQADGGQGGTTAYSYGQAVAIDKAGNSYITGMIDGPNIRFGNLKFGYQRYQTFLASYTRQGQLRWARVMSPLTGSPNANIAEGVVIDNAGSCYISGYCYNGWELDGIIVPLTGYGNAYLAKFNTKTGQLQWGLGTPCSAPPAIGIDKQGDVYLTSSFKGSITLGNIPVTSAGGIDALVARFDPDGTVDWATALGGPNDDYITAIAVDPRSRQSFVTGTLNSNIPNQQQTFLARLSPNGRVHYLPQCGGPGSSAGQHLAIDGQNNIYLTGLVKGTCRFGNTTLSSTSSPSYLARYGSPEHYAKEGETRSESVVSVFPNPAQNQFTLRLASPEQAGRATLYNQLGRVVAERPLAPSATSVDAAFDTSALPDGLYTLRLEVDGVATTRLVRVQH